MRYLLIWICIFSISSCFGQDVHLTQFYTSNLSLNPAYTGSYLGDIRLVANYRSQWSQVNAPIQTNMISAEKKIIVKRNDVGLGLLFLNDRLQLNTNKIFLSGSIQKNLQGHLLKIGLQGGIVTKRTNIDQTFPLQWNYAEGIYDQSKSSSETNIINQTAYPAFNVGLGWSKKLKNIKFGAGYSLFNLNRPVDGFVSNKIKLPFRHVGNLEASFYLKSFTVVPRLLYMRTAGATNAVFVANAYKSITKDVTAMLGAGYRGSETNSDAFLAYAGITYKRFDVGFSVDFNMSQLSNQSKNKTAYEISLIYTTPSIFSSKATIPCDRY